jgi:acetyl esterase/lipase
MRMLVLVLLGGFAALAQNPTVKPLYPGNQNANGPTLSIYLPAHATGTGVLVCPGGGYGALALDHEGKQIAEWFNSIGVAAFVLKYRHAPEVHHPEPLNDALAAMRMIRANASDYGVRADHVGVMGFSAGGHLAATLSTHAPADLRPNFAILVYPVISMSTKYTHQGSKRNLLGDNPDPALAQDLSNELAVTRYTPVTFLFHTDDDPVVPVQNSVLYYLALKAAGVPAEMHIYAHGRHGVGLAPQDPVLATWPARLRDWMKVEGYLP